MRQTDHAGGSAGHWGPLFGARPHDWAETWEGPFGYGTPLYEHVLERARIGAGTRLLDCGCGAGRFARMAADRGAIVAGIDAAAPLIAIAAERTPKGDFRVGDIEALPWPDASFDLVTGFNSFQFANDKSHALAEAGRVSRGLVVVVIPVRAAESGVTQIYKPMFPLFPAEGLERMKQSGIFSLSEAGKLEEALAHAELKIREDQEMECIIRFDSIEAALRAFIGAGPTRLAIQHSGEHAVTDVVRSAIVHFTDPAEGTVALPGWYRIVTAEL